jgi:Tol biopolymer transport system component
VDWSTGNLAVRDLASGAVRPVTSKQSWEESPSFPEFSVFSPEGERIAFGWFAEDWRFELRMMPVAGGEARVVFRDEGVYYVRPWAWSSDGHWILAGLVRTDQTVDLAWIPAEGGAARVIRRFGWRAPQQVGLSPDGRFVAFDVPRAGSLHRDIAVLALESGREWPLVEHPSGASLLGWAPRGARVLFASDRAGTLGIWSIPVLNGRAAGEPTLLRPDVWHILPIGFATDGRYFYGVNTGSRDVYSLAIDSRTGAPLVPPTALRGDAVPGRVAAWSPDGRYLATASRAAGPGTPLVIRIHDPAGHQVRDLTTAFATISQVVWSADGGSLFLDARDAQRRRGIFRIQLGSGSVTQVVAPEQGRHFRHLASSPDGNTLFYVQASSDDDDGFAIFSRSLQTGRETRLHSPRTRRITSLMRLSPDGRWIAFGEHPSRHDRTDAIRVMPAAGGLIREIYRVAEPILSELAWSPDGRHLVFGKRAGEAMDARIELWRVPVAGGAPEPLGISAPGLRKLHFHPDGSRLLYTAGRNSWELWVLEDSPATAAGTVD